MGQYYQGKLNPADIALPAVVHPTSVAVRLVEGPEFESFPGVEEKAKAEIIPVEYRAEKHFHEKENSVHGLQAGEGDDEVLSC
ncbi:hypothetical protein CDAR_605551 [Caerostris darwini]|uniref:Uncharacterized protein n=1 Tax=Caerostris darwini TaxID=1538125 RepID=A0AAV4RCS8_9ARAC|nr:hypothetical protein CDAR_605551 [Caerostris darwini]